MNDINTSGKNDARINGNRKHNTHAVKLNIIQILDPFHLAMSIILVLRVSKNGEELVIKIKFCHIITRNFKENCTPFSIVSVIFYSIFFKT